MANFTITTTDSLYTYATAAPDVKFKKQNNNKTSNTQGFLIKVQKGEARISATVEITAPATALNDNIYPMETHPYPVNVSFEENIPTRSTNIGKFALTGIDLVRQFENGLSASVKLNLVEIIQ